MSGTPMGQTLKGPVFPTPASGGGATRLTGTDATSEYERIVGNAQFQQLVRERTRFGWLLTGLMLVVYVGFIGLIAFDKPLLATKVGGATTSLGLFMGVGVILFAFILTGIYVARANTRYDALTADLLRSLGR